VVDLGYISLCTTPELLLSINDAPVAESCSRKSCGCVSCVGNAVSKT